LSGGHLEEGLELHNAIKSGAVSMQRVKQEHLSNQPVHAMLGGWAGRCLERGGGNEDADGCELHSTTNTGAGR
jgi:hypothetical protein